MNDKTAKCRQCFPPDADVVQDLCTEQPAALQLFNALYRQDLAPALCHAHDRRYRVCHERRRDR